MTTRADIVFFDMDHTLIDNDCDVSWKNFLIDEGLADASERATADRFWQLYCRGELPEADFLAFQMRQFAGRTPREMAPLLERHFRERVKPKIYPQAVRQVRAALERGAPAVMLTATNRPVAEPLARELGLSDIIATELELVDGRYTGRIVEPYCSKAGKVRLARAWCEARGLDLARAAYFGDSLADVPMLEAVAEPTVVNPSGELLTCAQTRRWRIETWALNHREPSRR